MVHARKPETRLIIAGDGSLNQALTEQRDALGLQDSVIMAGHVTDVIGLHHALDLYVQSSDYEGTPNSVLEAMAMETPIVATEAGGTAELVHDGEHGRIIPIGKVDRLIDGIESALSDRTGTRKMADRARIRVQGDLSFEARVRRVEGIYSEVMQPSASPGTAMREALKLALHAAAWIAVTPSVLSWRLRARVMGKDRAIEGSTQAWALRAGTDRPVPAARVPVAHPQVSARAPRRSSSGRFSRRPRRRSAIAPTSDRVVTSAGR